MMVFQKDWSLRLSSNGDSIEIKSLDKQSTIPQQLEAASCKTHEQVLLFLQKLSTLEIQKSFAFLHIQNPTYAAHITCSGALAHPCSLEQQIRFVQYKILEGEQKPIYGPKNLSCL